MDVPETFLEDARRFTAIHYVYRLPAADVVVVQVEGSSLFPQPGPGRLCLACAPSMPEQWFAAAHYRQHPWLRSDDPRAVTCPACKRTQVFERAMAEIARLT